LNISDNKLKTWFFLALLLLICYSPVYLTNYAFSDDWTYLYSSFNDPSSLLKWDLLSGRPVYGVLRYWYAFFTTDTVSFVYLRLFSVFSLIALCCYIYEFTCKREIFDNNTQRITFSLLLCLLPSFQVFAAWAVCFPYIISVLFSGISYSILSKNPDRYRIVLSAIVLAISFAIYQPAAMSFLFFASTDICLSKRNVDKKELIVILLILSFGMFTALIFAKILPIELYGEILSRTNFTPNIVKKIEWFIREPLKNAICNFDLGRRILYVIISLAIMAAGIVKIKSYGKHKPYLFMVLLILSAIPNLIVSESFAAYRSITAIAMIATSIFITGIFTLLQKTAISKIHYSPLIIGAMFLVNNNIRTGFSTPQQIEYNLFDREVIRMVPKEYTGKIYYRLIDNDLPRLASSSKYDEFGTLSLGIPWTFQGMAYSVKKLNNMKFVIPGNPIIYDDSNCPGNCIIIDSRAILPKSR
jgi:hypothetical protein